MARGFFGSIKHALGIGHDWEQDDDTRSQVSRESGLLFGRGRGPRIDLQPELEHSDYPLLGDSTRKAILDTRTLTTGLASAGKIGVASASAAKDTSGLAGPILGTAAGPVGVLSGLAEAGLKGKQIAQGREKLKDKALLGTQIASDLGSATAAGASTTYGISGLMHAGAASNALAAGSVAVAGPAALAMGGVDMVTGGVGAGLAEHRRRRLAAMEAQHSESDSSALLRMGKEAQKTKRNRNLGTVLKGALGVGAGGALLAGALGATAATPVGWGLLAGAGLVGLGVLGYRQWRKHREGTRILGDVDERAKLARLGVAAPTKAELARESRWRRWNPFNTKESRAHDLMRSSAAAKISSVVNDPNRSESQQNDEENVPLSAMVGHLGLRNTGDKKARKSDIARALEG